MGAADYHFLSHWMVKAPIALVFEILKDGPGYPRWWPCYVHAEQVSPSAVRALVRAKLPYTLEFTTELIFENSPTEIAFKSAGELIGTGRWLLKQDGEHTAVRLFWDVRTEKSWMKLLSPLLRPIFQWNHDWVMKTGEAGLKKELERRSRAAEN